MEALIGMIQTLVSSFLGQLWARDGQTFPACLAPRQQEQLSLLVKTTEVGSICVCEIAFKQGPPWGKAAMTYGTKQTIREL